MKSSDKETADEFLAELHADPEWTARQQERDRRLQEQAAAYRKAEAPLVEGLNRARGVAVQSVWDLVNTKAPYPAAVSILLEHLMRPYPERVREGIARALAVPEAGIGWAILLRHFERKLIRPPLG